MASEQQTIDVAVLVPITPPPPTPAPDNPALAAVLARLPSDSVVAKTAGALHTDQPFPGTEAEREAAAIAIAHDIASESEG